MAHGAGLFLPECGPGMTGLLAGLAELSPGRPLRSLGVLCGTLASAALDKLRWYIHSGSQRPQARPPSTSSALVPALQMLWCKKGENPGGEAWPGSSWCDDYKQGGGFRGCFQICPEETAWVMRSGRCVSIPEDTRTHTVAGDTHMHMERSEAH